MKKVLILLALISLPAILCAEEPLTPAEPQKDYPAKVNRNKRPVSKASTFPRWAVHSNLLGFVQFGPVLTAEYNITRSLSFAAHTRFSSLGALTPILHQADVDRGGRPDDFSGIAFGGGPMWYFKTKKDKVYVGLLFEYEMSDALYQQDYVNEWAQENRKMILMLNSGYRFRFAQKIIPGQHRPFDKFLREALFLNTGIYAGAERNQFSWDYTDPESIGADDTTPSKGKEIKPFGMLEVSMGIEF
jgi:hypothetical protein